MQHFRTNKKSRQKQLTLTGFSPKKTQVVVMLMNRNPQPVDSRRKKCNSSSVNSNIPPTVIID
jgi:hypothetical protein